MILEVDMSKEQHKEMERRMVEEAINKGTMSVVDEGLTPDFVYHGPGGREVKGIEAYKQFLSGLRSAYPDIHVKIEDILAENDLVATRTLCTFTAKGKDGKEDKHVAMAGSILDRISNGKIAETWELYDRLDMFQQMGLVPDGTHPQPEQE
jgi:predicted ester cyclase